jgi:hypothetical protein
MQFTLLNVVAIFSPIILMATLRSIWREGQSRKLMLRMLPPECRPIIYDSKPANCEPRSHPLWTSRNCAMELLTESTMHAFEASANAYKPDRMVTH